MAAVLLPLAGFFTNIQNDPSTGLPQLDVEVIPPPAPAVLFTQHDTEYAPQSSGILGCR
jgi:hypothetical protein